MRRTTLMFALTLAIGIAVGVIGEQVLHAQQAPDPRVVDLVRAGRVRVALGLGPVFIATKDPVTGELRGPVVDLGRELAARIGVEFVPVEYPSPGAVMKGVRTGAWDVSFLAIDPARAAEVDFSPPYMEMDLTLMVPAGSSIRSVADADQPGVRIAAVRGDSTDLTLSRILKRAELVRADTFSAPGRNFEVPGAGQVDVRAGNRPNLLAASARLPGSRVLEDRFGVTLVAMVVPKGQAGRLDYVSKFIEEAKTSGSVKRAIEAAGVRGIQVAPAGNKGTQ
jgi:polar amino acid transport system substrate-binding protein